jgi:acyl-CoA thioester hydrolase
MYEIAVFQEGSDQVKAVGGFIQIWVDKASNKVLKDGVPKWISEPLQPLLKGSEQDPAVAKL